MKEEYVFIMGPGRTGSKLYKDIINTSDEISIIPEVKFSTPWQKQDVVNYIEEIGSLEKDSNVERLVEGLFRNEVPSMFWGKVKSSNISISKEKLIERIKSSDRSKKSILKLIIDVYADERSTLKRGAKFPVSFTRTNQLIKWFPAAKIIFLTRDPRAICVSQAKKQIRYFKEEINMDLPDIICKKALFLQGVIGYYLASEVYDSHKGSNNFHLSRFEDLLKHPKSEINKICDFLNIEFENGMLYPSVIGSSFENEKEHGFNKKAIDRWKKHISTLDKKWITLLTNSTREKFGYE